MRLRWPRSQTIWPLLLCTQLIILLQLLMPACSSPNGAQGEDHVQAAGRPQVPFHEGESADPAHSKAASAKLTPAADKGFPTEAGLPFQDSLNLPAGTLLTVRLNNQVSADDPQAGAAFAAVVDKPVVIEGITLVPAGASVAGRVESARASVVERDRGYVRLTLDGIALDGRELPIQTASLFARAKAEVAVDPKVPAGAVKLEKGRRLTFRLTEPVYIAAEPTLPVR